MMGDPCNSSSKVDYFDSELSQNISDQTLNLCLDSLEDMERDFDSDYFQKLVGDLKNVNESEFEDHFEEAENLQNQIEDESTRVKIMQEQTIKKVEKNLGFERLQIESEENPIFIHEETNSNIGDQNLAPRKLIIKFRKLRKRKRDEEFDVWDIESPSKNSLPNTSASNSEGSITRQKRSGYPKQSYERYFDEETDSASKSEQILSRPTMAQNRMRVVSVPENFLRTGGCVFLTEM